MEESMADEIRRENILLLLRYADENILTPIYHHIRQNTATFGTGIIVTWVYTLIQYLIFAERPAIELFVMISIVLSIVFVIAWVITTLSYLIMYVRQKRRIKHCIHLVTTGAPPDEIYKYIGSFLSELREGEDDQFDHAKYDREYLRRDR